MIIKEKKRGPAIRIILAAALLIAAAVLAVGVSYARYRINERQVADIKMGYGFASDSIFILANATDGEGRLTDLPRDDGEGKYASPAGWTLITEDKDVYRISFLLSNTAAAGKPAAADQDGYIEVFVTEAIDSDGLIIQLDSPGGQYRAVRTAVTEGSPYYKAYGGGAIYRFLNSGGERLTWRMPGGKEYSVPMNVTVWGEFTDPGALTVIACGAPVN